LRSAVARRLRLFKDNVDCFVVLSEFARGILIEEGYAEEQVEVLPNWVDSCRSPSRQDAGTYVAFAGRLRGEKGVDTLLEAARALPEIPFRLAGDGPLFEWLRKAAPPNVHFEGRLGPEEMSTFYRGARMLVVPSRWFEMSPLVVAEAMSHGLPIVASAIGALPELVEDGLTGELFAPGQARELADVVCRLWEDLPRCRRLGAAGRERATRKLGEEVYAERLFGIYARAIERVGKA
jgi:glycosyltransferase involved in cell wall biosynthesis